MNLHQPSEAIPPLQSDNTSNNNNNNNNGGDETVHNRRRTRTRSSGSYNDKLFENSSDEEDDDEEIVDHVSALLQSRQQRQLRQQDQNDADSNNDQLSMDARYNNHSSHHVEETLNTTIKVGESTIIPTSSFSSDTSSSCCSLQRQQSHHSDPPIGEYDTSYEDDDDDDDDEEYNYPDNHDNSMRLSAQQNRLRELMAQSEDCWGADLSDEEEEEWNTNNGCNGSMMNNNGGMGSSSRCENVNYLEKRQQGEMMSASLLTTTVQGENGGLVSNTQVMINTDNYNNNGGEDDNNIKNSNSNVVVEGTSLSTSTTSPKRKHSTKHTHGSGSNTHSSINIQNINYRHQLQQQQQQQQVPLQNPRQLQQQLSAKEQLLQQRIRHQQRLHRRHSNEPKEKQMSGGSSITAVSGGGGGGGAKMEAVSSSDRIRQLTAKSSQKSRLFPEEDDDDNSSTIVSNGSGMNVVVNNKSSSAVTAAVSAMQFSTTNLKHQSSPTSSSPPRRSQQQQQQQHPSLNSLPSRPKCQTFPDEADRKRIVGCLAAILASSYTHETAPHLLVRKETSLKQQSQQQQQQCYGDHQQLLQRQQRYEDQGQLHQQQQKQQQQQQQSSIEGVPSIRRPPLDVSLSSSSLEAKVESCVSPIKKKPPHQQHVGNNHPLSIDSTTSINDHQVLQPHKQQQQLIRQCSATYSSHNGNITTSPTPYGSSTSIHKAPTSNNTKAASFHQSFTSSINNSIQKASLSTTSSTQPPSKLKDELAEIRHRIRRHAIYSELLVSSADLLLLDSSHAKAFLPMLEGLLTKVEVDDDNVAGGGGTSNVGNDSMMGTGSSHGGGQQQRQSWKGRGFGGGGVIVDPDSLMQQQAASMKRGDDNAPPAATTALSNNRTRSNSVPRYDQPSMKLTTEKNTEVSEKKLASHPKGGDLYEPFPATTSAAESSTTRRTASSPSAPPSTPPPYAPLETVMVDKDLIAPFLQTLTPGAGFNCIALLLLNHLLRDGRGYDARVRHAFKRLAVVVLSHELKVGGILRVDLDDDLDSHLQQLNNNEDGTLDDADELARLAARKFESMEHAIAAKLIAMSGGSVEVEVDAGTNRGQRSSASRSQSQSAPASVNTTPNSSTHGGRIALAPKETPTSSQHGISREQLLRGIKVGTAGAVGATLFALTGGLAAPGIAAGLAAVAGGSALAAGVTTVLSSAAAITTIFGVGGAGLAGYKMHRRTKGLTEFDFQKEQLGRNSDAELFSTVCISGWLRDARDFQRPWGVSPSHPRIIDKQELLERFYFIHNPDNVHRVPEILKHWKGRYFQLWRALKEKYGSDPSNLFPLQNGPRISAELTHEESLSVDFLMDELGYTPKTKPPPKEKKSHFFGMNSGNAVATERKVSSAATRPMSLSPKDPKQLQSAQRQLTDSTLKKKKGLLETIGVNSSELASSLSLFSESETNSINDNSTHTAGSIPDTSSRGTSQRQRTNSSDVAAVKPPPKHLLTVWDYHANYGGELYTVRWESDLLMELCDSVADQMIEWGVSATKTILHTTVFATLMTAVTLPYSLVLAANAIDSSWTMATERADRAGVELAKNLIDSNAGHRPVVLVGFSMGARVIYSCLKELARHQEIWEDHQQKKKLPPSKRKQKDNNQAEEQLKYIREPASIVEDAILMGTPNHISIKSWEACRRIVAGRLVNCYSRKDLILSLMFQMKKFQGILRAICGTSPVTVNGVENYDVTDLVTGHTDYCLVSGEILKRVRHGEPQRASVAGNEVMAMVTTIKVANNDFSLASLADEAERKQMK